MIDQLKITRLVIWQIESKTGIDLRLLNSSESEILLKSYTQYELIDTIPSSESRMYLFIK